MYFFCSAFAYISNKAGRKTRTRRTQANAKCYAFHTKAIIYCCVLFEQTGNTIDETVQQQYLN